MATKIQVRRDTAANWSNINPVLSQGEPGLELDTNRLKYGDGISNWNLLTYVDGNDAVATASESASGQPIAVREVTGVKSFTFQTTGHRFVEVVSNQTYTSANTVVVPATVANSNWLLVSYTTDNGEPAATKLYINGNQVINNTYDYIVTFDGTNYTIKYTNDTFSANVGDVLLFTPWVNGTQAVYLDYTSDAGDLTALNNYANTNTIHIDLTQDGVLYTNSSTANGMMLLTEYPGKSYIVFDAWYNGIEGFNDSRKIISSSLIGGASGNVYSITFDGPARSVANAFVTVNVTSAINLSSSSTFYVQNSEVANVILTYVQDGNGYISINGTPSANITGFYPVADQGEYITYNGQWAIPLNSPVTCNVTDTVQLHFTSADPIRIDYYTPNEHNYSSPWSNLGYQWFNWNTDLPSTVNVRGNGVRGGKFTGLARMYFPLDGTMIDTLFNMDFDTVFGNYSAQNSYTSTYGYGMGNGNYPIYARFNPSGNFYGWSNGGLNGDNFAIFGDFYESGVFFNMYQYALNYIAQDIKVDIAYKLTVFQTSFGDWCC